MIKLTKINKSFKYVYGKPTEISDELVPVFVNEKNVNMVCGGSGGATHIYFVGEDANDFSVFRFKESPEEVARLVGIGLSESAKGKQ